MIRHATKLLVSAFLAITFINNESLNAQTVLLPSFRNFTYNGSVMVPDGGRIQMGGVGRLSEGAVTRGVPMLSNVPGLNRGFKNRAIGRASGNSNITATAEIIIMEEYEQEVLAEAARRQNAAGGVAEDVARKAAFLSKHIGRKSTGSSSKYDRPR